MLKRLLSHNPNGPHVRVLWRMKNVMICFVLATVLLESSAYAGIWVSSGGGSFKDEHNPWFVRSTANVNYCIDLDAQTISASADQVRQAVEGAITYWKEEFGSTQNLNQAGSLVIANQTFTEVDCATQPELRFVIGYGKLAQNEVDYFKDPNCLTQTSTPCDPTRNVMNYIGVTTRTDYDSVQLKGRGFVYISSDMGANVYQNDGNLIAPAWTQPNLLQYALIHEMGHVFGYPHLGNSIMSEVFLEQMLDQNLTYIFQKFPIEHFLFPGPVVENCNLLPNMTMWFQAPAGTQCIQFQLSNNPTANIEVLARPNVNTQPTLIGTLMGVNLSTFTDSRSQPGIFLHLTNQQAIFTQQETGFRAFMVGPSFLDFGAQANYVPANGGALSPVYFRLTSTSFTLSANQSGKIGVVFSYDSPIDLLLTQPQ